MQTYCQESRVKSMHRHPKVTNTQTALWYWGVYTFIGTSKDWILHIPTCCVKFKRQGLFTINCVQPPLNRVRIWPGGGERGTPHYVLLYREAPPERGTFFRLEVYEGVGISLVKEYKRLGESAIWVCKRAYKG